MNKILLAAKLVILIVVQFSVCPQAYASNVSSKDAILAERVESLYSIIDIRYTPEVARVIRQYTEKYPQTSSVLLGQSSIYFPIIENILRERNVPEQIKYLAVIESGLRPDARSQVGATGMWQFMKSTGKMYGLTINKVVDERKDVIKATHSAVDFLLDLHERYDDWALAMAAYNCGPGNVNKAIRKAGSKDFWEIQKYLPKETRRYIPKFIAMQYLMSYYHMHDIIPDLPEEDFRSLGGMKVYSKINLKDLSNQIDVPFDIIKRLNPAYIRNYIPKAEGKYNLILPEHKLYAYMNNEGMTSDHVLYLPNPIMALPDVNDTVERLLTMIAPVPTYVQDNIISNSSPNSHSMIMAINPKFSQQQNRRHRIKRGESIHQIAKKYGMNASKLLLLNDISTTADVKVGDELVIE